MAGTFVNAQVALLMPSVFVCEERNAKLSFMKTSVAVKCSLEGRGAVARESSEGRQGETTRVGGSHRGRCSAPFITRETHRRHFTR